MFLVDLSTGKLKSNYKWISQGRVARYKWALRNSDADKTALNGIVRQVAWLALNENDPPKIDGNLVTISYICSTRYGFYFSMSLFL